MRSMTGYGVGTADSERYRLTVSLRSVNHRFLDLQSRLPEDARAREAELVERIKARLRRGRVEVRLDVETLGERRVEARLRAEIVRAVQAALARLAEEGVVRGELEARDLVRVPGALEVRYPADDWGPADSAALAAAADAALDQLEAGREREGGKLRRALARRLEALQQVRSALEGRREQVRESLHAGLRERIAELLADAELPAERLAQEAALLVDKSDVREELDRLRAHLEHFGELMEAAGPHGKRLDFLAQEIQRELNTLGAKCRDTDMIRDVLEGKSLCEQLREQVQNVE